MQTESKVCYLLLCPRKHSLHPVVLVTELLCRRELLLVRRAASSAVKHTWAAGTPRHGHYVFNAPGLEALYLALIILASLCLAVTTHNFTALWKQVRSLICTCDQNSL